MAKRYSHPLTPEQIEEIKLLLANDNLAQHQIAAIYDVNQGRISEIHTGRRGGRKKSDS